MLHITPPLLSDNGERNHLARIRRQAKKRGFRVLKDWTGTFSLVDAKIEPPRALIGLVHVPLPKIETAVTTALPPPKVRKSNGAPRPIAAALAAIGGAT
jgi:hypothetical protein